MTSTEFTRSADGHEIAFTRVGSGPPVVSINGAMGYRGAHPTEGQIAQALADRFTVITYDRRGRGESGPADSSLPATEAVKAEVADVAALIDHAGGKAAILGFSSGAVLGLEAARAGLPITGLALWEPPFVVTADRVPVAPDYRDRLQQVLADGRAGDALRMIFTEPFGMPAEFVEQMRAEPYWAGLEQIAPSLANDAAIMGNTQGGDPASIQKYAAVNIPALVMYGGSSDAWLAGAATTLAGILPDAKVLSLPGQDHAVSPESIVPVLSDWLPAVRH